jgi:ribosome biogenesis protein MAK21
MAKPTKQTKQTSTSAAENLPSLDEKALVALTAKIEKGFRTGKSAQQTPGARKRTQKKANNGLASAEESKSKATTEVPEPSRGSKRDARGNRKSSSAGTTSGSRSRHEHNRDAQDEKTILLQEILALGGTEEDLDLVAGALSEDEDLDADSSTIPDKSFQKDLANFVSGLGIDGKFDGNASESDTGKDVEDDWEEAANSPREPAGTVKVARITKIPAEPMANVANVKNLETSSSEDPNRLVGISPGRSNGLTDSH